MNLLVPLRMLSTVEVGAWRAVHTRDNHKDSHQYKIEDKSTYSAPEVIDIATADTFAEENTMMV